jgi:hypothetical protein
MTSDVAGGQAGRGRRHFWAHAMALCLLALTFLIWNAPEASVSTASATASSLKQDCVKAGSVPPTIINTHDNPTKMLAPGLFGQSVPVHTEVPAMPEACRGVFQRVIKGVVKMQYYKNLKRKIKMGGFTYTSDEAGPAGAILSENSHTTIDNYHCATPGTSHVELDLRSTIRNLINGHIADRSKITRKLLEVQGHGYGC